MGRATDIPSVGCGFDSRYPCQSGVTACFPTLSEIFFTLEQGLGAYGLLDLS